MRAELSTAMTRTALWESKRAKLPSPAPRSAMVSGGIRRSSASAMLFHDLPGT